MIKDKRITNIPYLLAFIIVCFIVLPLGLLVSWYEYREGSKNMAFYEQETFNTMKSKVSIELEDKFSLLEFYYENAQEKLRDEVKREALNMHRIVEDILRRERKLGIEHGKAILKDLLKPMRFGEGNGYYFAISPDGIAHILPLNTELEGKNLLELQDPDGRKVVSDMIRIVDEKGSGLYRYRSFFPDVNGQYPAKIAFLKKIPNFDWIIGAVEFVDDVENNVRKMFIDIIQNITFHNSEFNFIIDEPGQLNTRFLNPTSYDLEVLDKILQKSHIMEEDCYLIQGSKNPYLVCSRYFKAWDWVVGFGVDTARINETIEKNKNDLRNHLKTELLYLLSIFIIVAVTVLLIGHHLKKTIEDGFSVFSEFFRNASQRSKHIDINALNVVEFKKLAMFANDMVDNLKNQDRVIRDYTGKLEKANRALKNMASRDGLTGVYNRRSFDELLKKEFSWAMRYRKPLALFMIDIDFFKKYNDTYGHLEGDNCLKKMATAMNITVRRPADMFARFGGEEFVALLPDTDEAGAVSIAVSMKEEVARLALQHEGSDISNCVTFSMGIALMIPDRNTISDELVNRADKALYQAKHLGRNRFVIYR